MNKYIVTDIYGEINLGDFKLIPNEIYLSNESCIPNDKSLSEEEQLYIVPVINEKTGEQYFVTQSEFEDFFVKTSL
ncbi:hypothetical protein BFS06_14565 [Clostridium perfringens]|uniref:Uncharacterized protein n=1 Tax=Clostridium perfringens TaxID=1502 RepID=A0A140GR94_CLOPF|nr:hypothetical protein [Clostridium perfringens]AMN31053.1 hypothetical protein JFP838_pA0137 [Clostridium perfringens]TBX14428.1 hypothetical protein BFS06_14565 [Clostridium perfringens]